MIEHFQSLHLDTGCRWCSDPRPHSSLAPSNHLQTEPLEGSRSFRRLDVMTHFLATLHGVSFATNLMEDATTEKTSSTFHPFRYIVFERSSPEFILTVNSNVNVEKSIQREYIIWDMHNCYKLHNRVRLDHMKVSWADFEVKRYPS